MRIVTRSLSNKRQIKNQQKNIECYLVKKQITDAIDDQQYQNAFKLINKVQASTHWHQCTCTKILFHMKNYQEAVKKLQNNIISNTNSSCQDCIGLFLKIVQISESVRSDQYKKLIYLVCNKKKLHPNLGKKYLELMRQAASDVSPDVYHFNRTDNLVKYYEGRGSKFSKLKIVEIQPNFRVSIAKQKIGPFEPILFIPKDELITLEVARQSKMIQMLEDIEPLLKSPKHSMLSVFLLAQDNLGKRSKYYQYIDSLPRKLPNFPYFYKSQHLDQLKETSFLSLLEMKKAELNEDYQNIMNRLKDDVSYITKQRFAWARLIVSSRIFGIIINNQKTDALVPIADMLNHKMPKMTTWRFSDEKNGFTIDNCQNQIHPGQQIYDSYGIKCNSRFLMFYGFVQGQNPHNQVSIPMIKYGTDNQAGPIFRFSQNFMSLNFVLALQYYRKKIDNQQNMEDENKLDSSSSQDFISNSNQLVVWRYLSRSFQRRMKQYPTTIKTDQKLLKGSLTPNTRNCIQIRLGEKQVLTYYIEMSKKIILYFDKPNATQKLPQYKAYFEMIKQAEDM